MLPPPRYRPPGFCDHCGTPHPWASRQQRLWQIENLLERGHLSEADQLTLREKFEELANPDLTEDDQVERWKAITRIAPSVLDTARRIAESLLTSYMKGQLGL